MTEARMQEEMETTSLVCPPAVTSALTGLSAGTSPLNSVIQVFPWHNGITLLQGSMTATLQEWWESDTTPRQGIDSSLIMAQAESLDTVKFDHSISDPRTQALLRRLLSMDRETFLSQEAWTNVDQHDIATITHILVRLHILDQFVDALSFPPNPLLRVMSKLRFPRKLPDQVDRIFKHLKDWSAPIEGLRRAFATTHYGSKKSKSKAIADSDFSTTGRNIALPRHATPEAIVARNDILTLWRAFEHVVSSNLHTILSHTELMTASASWFSQRHMDFPESAAKLGEAMWDRAREVGLELPSNFREEFLTKEVAAIFNRMKVCFHVAGTISPLAILVPTQWSNYQIGRDHLLTILYALGNERPAALLEVEQALCNCIMRIMGGSDAMTQLKHFLEEYDAMKRVWAANGVTDLNLNFFDNAFLGLPTQSASDVTQTPIGPPPLSTNPVSLVASSAEPSVPEPTVPPIGIPGPALSQSTPPPTSTLQDGLPDMASTINQAITANYAANAALVNHPKDITWTLPGTQTLTPQAQELANTYIDQSKFPEGVSPITKIFRELTPVSIVGAWTEEELERLARMNLNRMVTPPPMNYPELVPNPEGEREGFPDQDTLMEQEDDDIFTQILPHSPSPLVKHPLHHSPQRSMEPITHDEDQVMADENVDGENLPDTSRKDPENPNGDLERAGQVGNQDAGQDGSGLSHGQEEQDMHPKDTLDTGKGRQEHQTEKEHLNTAPAGTQSSADALIDPPPANKPLKPSQTAPPAQPTSLPARNIRRNIVMSSSDGSDGESDGSDGESELSSPRSGPVPKKREPTKSISHSQTKDIPDPVSSLRHSLGPNFGSKPTLYGSLGSQVSGPTNMVMKPTSPMVKEPFSFQYFSLDPTSEPATYNFVTHKSVAKTEFGILKNVQELVESNYVNGRPRHHLPAARQVPFTPNSSVFFIIDYPEFMKMSAHDIHLIARTRHIVVQHVPQEDFTWSLETLLRLGNLTQNREIQAGECRDDAVEGRDGTGMLKVGSLEQLYTAADKRVLLALSLPLGASGLVDTPRLRDLSSDRWAWVQTDGTAGFRKLPYLSDDTTWGTVGTAGSTSFMHLDDAGLCTSTQILTGKKYWVTFYRDPSLAKHNPAGDLGSIDWAPDFSDLYDHKVKNFLTAEAVEMVPGTLLFQRSNVLHYVLTMEHTITQGQHYYLTTCLQPTAHQIAHSFARRFTITNQHHDQTPTLLRRLLCCSIDWFVSGRWTSGMQIPLHVIDITHPEGLLDIIALGNIIEFTPALDLRTYEDIVLDEKELLEIEAAMARYRSFIRWFSKKYGLLMGGTWINPTYLFKRRLASFAASVCVYFAKQHLTTQRQSYLPGISPSRVKTMFRLHIQKCWPDLIGIFDHLLTAPSSFLYHTGPTIHIIRKTDLHLLAANLVGKTEDIDYTHAPIYLPAPVPPTTTQPTAAPAAQKRSHILTGSATSPSSNKVTKRKK